MCLVDEYSIPIIQEQMKLEDPGELPRFSFAVGNNGTPHHSYAKQQWMPVVLYIV